MSHTILLVQSTTARNEQVRSYDQYSDVASAMDRVCALFEISLKTMHPDEIQITYDIRDLHKFIDSLPDLAALTLNEREGTYSPRNKSWIKQEVLKHLTQQANQ